MKNKFNYVSVQPLSGGMSIGFEKYFGPAKLIISNNDSNDPFYIEYCEKRNLNIPVIKAKWDPNEDYEEIKEQVEKYVNEGIDVVTYVPICAGMSRLNTSTSGDKKFGDANNMQNQNMYNLTKFILGKLLPKVAVMENAPALGSPKGKDVLERLKNVGKELGYTCTLERTNTCMHGIPQQRPRTFVYFWKKEDIDYVYNIQYENKPFKYFTEYLKDIPEDAEGTDYYPKSKYSCRDIYYQFLKEKFNFNLFKDISDKTPKTGMSCFFLIVELGLLEELKEWAIKNEVSKIDMYQINRRIKKINDNKNVFEGSIRYHNNGKTCRTICARNFPTIYNYDKDTNLTIRDFLYLMGMPHDYWPKVFEEGKKEWMLFRHVNTIVAQNVPVNTASHAAYNCLLFLNGELNKKKGTLLITNNIKQKIEFIEVPKDEGNLF